MEDFARDYFSLLNGPLAGLNLTRIGDQRTFYCKQVLDSILPLEHSRIFVESLRETQLLLDVGFGAGFPLMPLARRLPEVSCCGLEARQKKVEAVDLIKKHFRLENVTLFHHRLERLFLDCPATLTFKAVGGVKECLEMIRTNQKIRAFFYKGPNFCELESLEKLPEHWKLIEERVLCVPSTKGRLFLGFENVPSFASEAENGRIRFRNLIDSQT